MILLCFWQDEAPESCLQAKDFVQIENKREIEEILEENKHVFNTLANIDYQLE